MPGSSDIALEEAIALIKDGALKDALEILQNLVKDSPDSIEAWYNLGYVLTELDREEEAIKAYDEALAIDNGIFEIWFNKANALYNIADFKEARICYEQALEIDPEDAEAWNNLGNCFSRLAEGQKAIEAYTRAVAIRPDYAEAFYNKANAHFIEEEDERAIAYGELAIKLNPRLEKRVAQWMQVARDRLRSKEDERAFGERGKKIRDIVDKQ
jgi:tetratricopeptide (TPR) repeat protein